MHSRYQKQTKLPEIGKEGQVLLKNARVLCVGAGGLASAALPYLAGAGIGKIGIVDFDHVELSNLHRQPLFIEGDLNLKKSEAAKDRLCKLNSDIEVVSYSEKMCAENVDSFFLQYDIILDCTDQFDVKYLLSDAAVKLNKPLIYGSAVGFEGQVGLLAFNRGACLRCIFPEATLTSSCDKEGAFGPAVAVIGALQASEAIKFITDLATSTHALLNVDLRTNTFLNSKIKKRSDCIVCSIKQESIQYKPSELHCLRVARMSAEEAIQKLNDSTLVDVREDSEQANEPEHKEALNYAVIRLPLSKIRNRTLETLQVFKGVTLSKRLIIGCTTGERALEAAKLLGNMGFTDVVSLKTGMADVVAHLKIK